MASQGIGRFGPCFLPLRDKEPFAERKLVRCSTGFLPLRGTGWDNRCYPECIGWRNEFDRNQTVQNRSAGEGLLVAALFALGGGERLRAGAGRGVASRGAGRGGLMGGGADALVGRALLDRAARGFGELL